MALSQGATIPEGVFPSFTVTQLSEIAYLLHIQLMATFLGFGYIQGGTVKKNSSRPCMLNFRNIQGESDRQIPANPDEHIAAKSDCAPPPEKMPSTLRNNSVQGS